METYASPPSPTPLDGERASVHGTALSISGRGLLLFGKSGSGKSSVAAGLIALGATLVSDDLVVLSRQDGSVRLSRPAGAPAAIELRGIGVRTVEAAPPVDCTTIVFLTHSRARLPEPETWSALGVDLPMIRHPATPDCASKLMVWLR